MLLGSLSFQQGCGIDRLDDDSWVVGCCNCVSLFNGSPNTCGNNAAGRLIHGCARQKDAQSSFLFELEWVSGHCLVCIHELKLMHLGLRGEDLGTPLLRHVYPHCLTEIATI